MHPSAGWGRYWARTELACILPRCLRDRLPRLPVPAHMCALLHRTCCITRAPAGVCCAARLLLPRAAPREQVKGLSLTDQFTLVNAPIDAGDTRQRGAFLQFAQAYAAGRPVLLDESLMPSGPPVNELQMADVEGLHKVGTAARCICTLCASHRSVGTVTACMQQVACAHSPSKPPPAPCGRCAAHDTCCCCCPCSCTCCRCCRLGADSGPLAVAVIPL